MKFKTPTYVFDGQEVWIPWPTVDKPRQGARCIVKCAMGNTARIINRSLDLDRWIRVDALYIDTEKYPDAS